MFSVGDFKITVSSVEFSLFFQQNCSQCPNCGQVLDNYPLSEVKFSSLVLLLGFGSIVCYKLMSKKKKKRKKIEFRFGFENQINDENSENIDLFYENLNSSDDSKDPKTRRRYKVLTSTPFVDWVSSLDNKSSKASFASSGGSELGLGFDDIIDGIDSSLQTPSMHRIGNKTVAKLDQLLDQINDIKQSVYEIDEQIFDVKESNIKFEPKMFSLGPDMSSSLTTESEEKYSYLNTEPQTPTLEWDLTDLNGFNGINQQNYCPLNGNQLMISSLNSSNYLRHQSFGHKIEKSFSLESPEELSNTSISTSGQLSISSTTEPKKDNNLMTIQRMISDAKKLGLLDDLIDVLIKGSKRDSAFYED